MFFGDFLEGFVHKSPCALLLGHLVHVVDNYSDNVAHVLLEDVEEEDKSSHASPLIVHYRQQVEIETQNRNRHEKLFSLYGIFLVNLRAEKRHLIASVTCSIRYQ